MQLEITNFSEIKSRHPDEWVLLGDPKIADAEILGGAVLFHSRDKQAVMEFAKKVIDQYKMVKIVFTGEMPKIARLGIFREEMKSAFREVREIQQGKRKAVTLQEFLNEVKNK
jgi:hypothetical protein